MTPFFYEFSFRNDNEHGVSTGKRSDLHITDERGESYILDVTICDPTNSLCVNHGARGQSSSLPALQLLYDNHVKTYENSCDKQDLIFIPLAFDTLGRMHPDSAKLLHNALSSIVSTLPRSCSSRATPCGVGRIKHSMPLCPQRCWRACKVPACATRRSIRTSRAMAA